MAIDFFDTDEREDFLKLMAGERYSQARIYKGMY